MSLASDNTTQSSDTQSEIVIGALLALTGEGSSLGEASKVALEIAVEDTNEYLASIGSEMRMRLIIEDTRTDPAVALEKLQNLSLEGVKVVIGPAASAEIEAVKAYADENDILLISHASTAPSLAIPGDNVFRFCTDDTYQAAAIANRMWDDGVRVLVPMWRGDVWGDDLTNATNKSFKALDGTMVDGVRYNVSTVNFSTAVDALNSTVAEAIALYGDVVAVHLIAFEEVVPIFIEAQNLFNFSNVRWYGCDATALNKELVQNDQAARFAVRTGFECPIAGCDLADETRPVMMQIKEKLGRTPEAYAIVAYDALWVITYAYQATGETDDIEVLKSAVENATGDYYGSEDWSVFNKAGDMKYGNYDFWVVVEAEGAFMWKRVAKCKVSSRGSVRFLPTAVLP
ncbi:branched-chain amino acid transport system substrate-binding protein [Methanophagales archaeon]|nr:branched-chain amino acid transport system substrate-binding protein [Methanophagales archaeon]